MAFDAQSPTLAVIDGQAVRRRELSQRLSRLGYEVRNAAGCAEVDADPALVIAAGDERRSTSTVLASCLHHFPDAACLAVVEDADEARSALEGGAADVLRTGALDEMAPRVALRLAEAQRRAELQRRSESMEMVLETTRTLSSTLDLRTLLHAVVRRIAEIVEVDRASVVLGNAEDETGYVVATSDDESLRDLPIQLSGYPEIMQVLTDAEPLVVEDAQSHPLMRMPQVAVPERFRSLTLFPILFEQRAIGVLFLRFERRRQLSHHDTFALEAIANAAGIALRNASLLENLREQNRAERSAHEHDMRMLQRYIDFFDSSADGILVLDGEGRVVFCNPAACAISGRSPDELRDTPLEDLLARDGRRKLPALRRRFELGNIPQKIDLPIVLPSGQRRVLDVSFSRLHDEGSSVIVSMRDVTDERALARELTKTKEFFQRVIDSSVDAIVAADMRGEILLFNPAAEHVYGLDAEQVVGKMHVRDLYPEGQAEEIMRLIRSEQQGENGVLQGYEAELVGKEGQRIPVVLSASLIYHRGRPIGSVGVFKDMRAKLAIEERLATAQRELAEKEQKAFIAELAGATAHELNQPLTTIMGYAGLLERKLDGDQRLKNAVNLILREAERMAEIVRKIGKLTKYESKNYVGDTKIIDIEASVDSEPPSTQEL